MGWDNAITLSDVSATAGHRGNYQSRELPGEGPPTVIRGATKDSGLLITVTDTMHGRAAEGVPSRLERQADGEWQILTRAVSDLAGTIMIAQPLRPGTYRLELDTESYFALAGLASSLPRATAIFRVPDNVRGCRLDVFIAGSSQFFTFTRPT